MQQASNVVLNNKQCRDACGKHFPIDKDELFNQTWLDLREKEIQDPEWRPNNAVAYFLIMIRNKAIKLKKEHSRREPLTVDVRQVDNETDERIERETMLLNWVDSPSENEEVYFYKCLIRILLFSRNINEACKIADLNRKAFWEYRKLALIQFYEDTNFNTNFDHVRDGSLV